MSKQFFHARIGAVFAAVAITVAFAASAAPAFRERQIGLFGAQKIADYKNAVARRDNLAEDCRSLARMIGEKEGDYADAGAELERKYGITLTENYRYDEKDLTVYLILTNGLFGSSQDKPVSRAHRAFVSEAEARQFVSLVASRRAIAEDVLVLRRFLDAKQKDYAVALRALKEGFGDSEGRKYRLDEETGMFFELLPMPTDAEIKAQREAEARAEREAKEQARLKAEAEKMAAREAERRAEAERKAAEKARAEREAAEKKAKAEAEAKAKAEMKAAKEAERKARAEREAAEAKAKAEAEAKARAELKARKEAEKKARAEREAAEAKAKAEAEALAKAEKARAEAAARQKKEAEARARREAEERVRAEKARIKAARELQEERAAAAKKAAKEAEERRERERREAEKRAKEAARNNGKWL